MNRARPGGDLLRRWPVYLGGIVMPLAVYAVFMGYPAVKTVWLSFQSWDGLSAAPVFVGLENWRTLLKDPGFLLSLGNNLKWAAVALLVPVGLGLLLAAFLASGKVYLAGIMRALLFLPSTMSLVVIGLMFTLILNPVFGGLNTALTSLGLDFLVHDWLGEPGLVLYTLTGVFAWAYIGLPMFMFYGAIMQVPTELYEAARIEGANALQTLVNVTIPVIRPVIAVVALLTIIESFRAFDIVMVMTRGGPFKQSSVLAYQMYVESFLKYRFGYGAAIATCILLLSLIFYPFYLKGVAGEAEYAQ